VDGKANGEKKTGDNNEARFADEANAKQRDAGTGQLNE